MVASDGSPWNVGGLQGFFGSVGQSLGSENSDNSFSHGISSLLMAEERDKQRLVAITGPKYGNPPH
jgi:hypothetical protein